MWTPTTTDREESMMAQQSRDVPFGEKMFELYALIFSVPVLVVLMLFIIPVVVRVTLDDRRKRQINLV